MHRGSHWVDYWKGKGTMIVIFAALAGAAWGGYLAKKRGGNRLDIAQYAASSAIAFGLLALFASIVLARVL